ncbi:helix-turn-helix transcriptional regulator [Paenibacillus sp. P25]|nr:helix-turn-helix transcriptional regulator [Paenibacillus sp. P25]
MSLNLISDQFNINAKYSDHLFKEEYGMKFVDFLMNLRMDQAKKLLLESDLSIQEISEKVGYTHSISFGRTFKKVVGVTPGDYRKYMQPD